MYVATYVHIRISAVCLLFIRYHKLFIIHINKMFHRKVFCADHIVKTTKLFHKQIVLYGTCSIYVLVMHRLLAKYRKSVYWPHFCNIGNRFFLADFWQIIK